MHFRRLLQVLESAAAEPLEAGITYYRHGDVKNEYHVSYSELLQRAQQNSLLLRQREGFQPGSIVLIHFKNHCDNIEWFWSVLAAGGVPAMSTPFSNNDDQRRKHVVHLSILLKNPLCITRRDLITEFAGQEALRAITVESLCSTQKALNLQQHVSILQQDNDLAVLMLTSGSTGNAKAVCLTHEQILSAIDGKSSCHGTRSSDTLFNWIALDHVASLIEIHLHAMYLGAKQIHVHAADLLQNPMNFLMLLSKHRVTFSFAPNFFLAKLQSAWTKVKGDHNMDEKLSHLDLTCLRTLTSGGEANAVETCIAMDNLFQSYGTNTGVICPGFGMTETCAGSIFNTSCPLYDVANKREFAALGSCIRGIRMRIVTNDGNLARPNEIGNLELTGSVVFNGYYNNDSATADAFTSDGWFRTGDQGFIDSSNLGQLNLIGRAKETMIINGVKYNPFELQTAMEDPFILGITQGFTVVFSYRPKSSPTEHICVVYVPAYTLNDVISRVHTNDAICKVTMLQTGVRPCIVPLDKSMLQKSTLGKLSRGKIKTAFERGEYLAYQELNDKAVESYKATIFEGPANEAEAMILRQCKKVFGLSEHELGVNANFVERGITSIDLIRLKQKLQIHLNITDVPIFMIMTNPTVRTLACAIQELKISHEYNPVVVLQSQGSKKPLWLIHPGVGEVLVFLALARYMTDRPVYALRARGFDGEGFFHNIGEAVAVYHEAIKLKQPDGPYAIAGYSYGSMLAFEVAKVLKTKHNDDVRFLGSFNLPPHIKSRMQQLDWVECLLNLSYFLELIDDRYALAISPELRRLDTKDQVVAHIVQVAVPNRMDELGLDGEKLGKWADVALSLQSMARDYDPSGVVDSIDVFYAVPLIAVASSKDKWLSEHLSKWKDFSQTTPRFHEVDGAHYTMISPSNVFSFQKKLKSALQARGL